MSELPAESAVMLLCCLTNTGTSHAAGMQLKPDAVDPGNDVQPAYGAQCIWPQHLPRHDLQPDSSMMRCDLASSLRRMYREELLTDFDIELEGVPNRFWKVHQCIMASCSPFLQEFLTGGPSKTGYTAGNAPHLFSYESFSPA